MVSCATVIFLGAAESLGLLDVLDHHKFKKGESYEVEYRLVSWGEIYPPFLGDREHSLAARFILHDFPFKLFSVSIPYSEIPQKLCLTFHSPAIRTESGNISAVDYDSDDTAKEF